MTKEASKMRTSASFSFNPKERHSVSTGAVEAEFKTRKSSNLASGATGKHRRMSINHYKKEKSVVVILVLVTVMFTFATIPSGIVRIFQSLYPECRKNDSFKV